MTPRSFYVTTPIYYVNDVPHLGTAYTTIAADALKRFHALRGEDARLLTGTDEHGMKLERVATERGMAPQDYVDSMSAPFKAAWDKLGIGYDDFIRTTETRHKDFVQDLWTRVRSRGFLYEASYDGWYCVGCEAYKTEKELEPGNLCPIHKAPAEKLAERTYFFKLSAFEKPLLEFYERHPDFVKPTTRLNEVLSFVRGGLQDLSVSRTSFSWGIPVPDAPGHIMYVWFDALANYLSALGGVDGALGHYWPRGTDTGRVTHLVGKDILRFHAVYWPAFLMAAGYTEEQMPSQIVAHGFLTVDGQKMSKSLRNAVNPVRIAEELGRDVLRFQLLRAIPFGQDGDFDHAAMLERYNADLGKNLGNLLARTLGLCVKMTASKVPAIADLSDLETELHDQVDALLTQCAQAWENAEPHRALEATWAISSLANQYVDRAAPWALAKAGNTAHVGTVLSTLLSLLETLSRLITPVMPDKGAEMRAQLGLPPHVALLGSSTWPMQTTPMTIGHELAPGAPLFQTLDKDQTAAMLVKLVPPAEVLPMSPVVAATATRPATTDEPLPAIAYDDFARVDLRVGLVLSAERVPKKDKLLKLAVDVGEPEPRAIVAGLALTFAPEQLIGRRVVVVANLAPRDFGKGLVSHGMLLASGPSEALILASIADDAAPGSKLK